MYDRVVAHRWHVEFPCKKLKGNIRIQLFSIIVFAYSRIRIKMTESTPESMSLDKLMKTYLDTLSEKEKQGYHIAKEHLGMSFQLEKSVGFLNWKEKMVSDAK